MTLETAPREVSESVLIDTAILFRDIEKIRPTEKLSAIRRFVQRSTQHDEVLKEVFRVIFDPATTTGIGGKFSLSGIEHEPPRGMPDGETIWEAWVGFIRKLETRQLTGNAAREEAFRLLLAADPRIRKLFMSMLTGKLTIGVNYGLIGQIYPGLITKFSCQLAEKWSDGPPELEGPSLVETKLDGVRGLIFLDPTNPHVLSRNGKPLNNVSHVIAELMTVAKGYVIDGEFFSADWRSTISSVRSKEKGDTGARLFAFDVLPLEEFRDHVCSWLMCDRRRLLIDMIRGLNHIKPTTASVAQTVEDAISITAGYTKAGYEGSVIKGLDTLYEYDRTESWRKMKTVLSDEFEIVGVNRGEGQFSETLGSLIVRPLNKPGEPESAVGSGLTRADRDTLWAQHLSQGNLIGEVVEVAYQELTPDRRLRFPVFMRLRPDR